jgi:hypothetical protein
VSLVRVEITGLDQLARMREALGPELLKRATRAGVAAAAKSVAPKVAQSISQRYGLPSRRVRADVRASQARRWLLAPFVGGARVDGRAEVQCTSRV